MKLYIGENAKMEPNFIKKYFYVDDGNEEAFTQPATVEQIVAAEEALGIDLPADYKDFLLFSDGFDGYIRDFVVILNPVEAIYKDTRDILGKFFPWAIFIGSNAGGEYFVIDKRQTPLGFGLLPTVGGAEDFIPLGNCFEDFIKHLYEDTVYNQQ